MRGGQGEDVTFEVLNSLPDNYYWLWRDVKIDYGKYRFCFGKRNQNF